MQLEWLRVLFSQVHDFNDTTQIKYATKAYLLFLLGYTLFIDKSVTRVPVIYLILLKYLFVVREYAWGAATLAYLYRQLGITSQAGVKQMVRYITLLEGWIYELFPHFTPNRNISYSGYEPHVYKWIS